HQLTKSGGWKEGESREDEAARPAAYRLPPPEQLPEISRTDETVSVPVSPCELAVLPAVPAVVDGGFVIDVSPPVADLSSVPRISTRWFTCFWRSSSFPLSVSASLPDADEASLALVLLGLVPAVLLGLVPAV